MSRERFYIWLDDWDSCSPGEYRIGDSLVRCNDEEDEKCDGTCWNTYHDVKTFYLPGRQARSEGAKDEDVKAAAIEWMNEMNAWWDATSRDQLGILYQEKLEENERLCNHQNRLEGELSKAVGLIIRFYHEHLTDQSDLSLDADLAGFWNYWTKKAMPEEVWGVAYDSGLPLDQKRRQAIIDGWNE